MSVTAVYKSEVTVTETMTGNVVDVPSPTAVHSTFNKTETLTAVTTPPATTVAAFSKALSGGAATMDLTALTGTNGLATDFTGLKVQYAKFVNPSTNANTITVTFGASNGYLLGGTGWKIILSPGMEFLFRGNDATPDVDSTHKNIDIAGTGSQALNVILVAG